MHLDNRILALFAVFLTFAFVYCGCGEISSSSGKESEGEEGEAVESEAEGGREGEGEGEGEGGGESESESECVREDCDDSDPCTTDRWDVERCQCAHTSLREDCDDEVDCTDDSWDDGSCQCRHEPNHAYCFLAMSGSVCDPEEDCRIPEEICNNDEDCPALEGGCLVGDCDLAVATCFYHIRDLDGDGHAVQTCEKIGGDDCDDTDANIFPGASEVCDGLDNDCDRIRDGFSEPCGSDVGECISGERTCADGEWSSCAGEVRPRSEICNGLDDDCDGEVDEGLHNACDSETVACLDGEVIECACCDGLDNDSDGLIDREDFDCASDFWCATSTVGAPALHSQHTAVWTGSEMIVWGADRVVSRNIGARYNPVADFWTWLSLTDALAARFGHTAVWTGDEMIVWGGTAEGFAERFNSGGRYDPATDSWTATSTADAPSGRAGHTAIWTGAEMIVCGGSGSSGSGGVFAMTGGQYSPAADSWTATSTADAPSARDLHTAVWTGSEMIVWGGFTVFGEYANTGGRYNPVSDSWAATSIVDAPSGRTEHTAIWTGSEMIVWGGGFSWPYLNTGGRYDPTTNSWSAIDIVEAPSERVSHTAVWTDSEMIVWGGRDGGDGADFRLNTGGRYVSDTDTWTATAITNAPSTRDLHTAVWTGSEMIVWGGASGVRDTNTGGRYTP